MSIIYLLSKYELSNYNPISSNSIRCTFSWVFSLIVRVSYKITVAIQVVGITYIATNYNTVFKYTSI